MEQGVWTGVGRWRGDVVLVDVRAGGAHHTQIDVAPLLEDQYPGAYGSNRPSEWDVFG